MESEDHPSDDATALRRAGEELRAAELLLLEEDLPPAMARVHLDRAREVLGASPPEDTGAPREDEETRRAALAELHDLRARHAERGLDPTAARRARRARLLVAIALVLIPAALYVGLRSTSLFSTPWRASYYRNQDFEGDAIVRWEDALEHDWGNAAPVDEIPPDGFSVRWETCLVLEDDLSIAFQLGADDGARLFIDGEQIVDNWGKHRFRSRSARVRLDARVHHIEVRYFEARRLARISLLAAIDDAAPAQLPTELLRAPTDTADSGEPCRGIRD
jgi:hypothetical protein